ncbi:MAG TPA: hypothetical protein VK631_06990 [Solirubrobacteraceae bacterium]|nr:hypothetical protein [Solirubrobacteraceae bacterium]
MASLNDMIKTARDSYQDGYVAGYAKCRADMLEMIKRIGGVSAEDAEQVQWLDAIEREHSAR